MTDRPWIPLSPAQQQLWLADQLGPGQGAYQVSRSFWLDGDLDPDVLRQAIGAVVRRQEVLRCRIVEQGGRAGLVREAPESVHLERIDLRGRPDAADRALRTVVAQVRLPSSGTLLRPMLISVAERRFLFHYAVHHIGFDARSRVIFERELSAAYGDIANGRTGTQPPLPMSYAEHATRLRQRLDAGDLDDELDYWVEHLRGAPTELEWLADRTRPPTWSGAAAHLPLAVGDQTLARLRHLAADERTSLYVVCLAAYQFVLATAARSTEVVVGTAYEGRTDPAVEQVVGLFASTVPLRARIKGAPSLRTLVRQARETVLAGLDNQEVPFHRIVEALAVTSGPANPLFQHWFALTDDRPDEATLMLPDVECTPVELPVTVTRFDTELELRVVDGSLGGRFGYAVDLFTDSAARRLAAGVLRLLDRGADRPDVPLTPAVLMDEEDRRRLRSFAAAPATAPAERPAHEPATPLAGRFAAQVARTPDAVAVADAATALTYRELAAAAAGLAAHLARAGIGPGDIVGIYLPRGVDLVVAMLATVTSGAAYLPIDTATPPERVAYQLTDSAVTTVLTSGELVPTVANHAPLAVDRLTLDRPASVVCPVWTSDLLYVIYTSGSTGEPKGVAVTHDQFLPLVDWHLATYRLSPADHVAQVASVSFDAAGWEIWPTLLSGAALRICPDDVVRAPDELVDWLAGHGCTVMFAPTPLAEQLLRHPLRRDTRLRALLTGGDVFRPRPSDDPGIDVFNHYGPTENAVVATATHALRAPWEDNSIGRPIAGTTIHLLDDALNPVPPGMVGEVFLGGAAVAWGYWHRPGLTAERFIPDPFDSAPGARPATHSDTDPHAHPEAEPHPQPETHPHADSHAQPGVQPRGRRGARLYRTGDLARWRDDGTLSYLGRADRQVKVRGYRIEPGEVESAVLSHPAVTEAVVAAVNARSGQPVLACYIVASEPSPPPVAALRHHLSARLPGYLIPDVFVDVPNIPRTLSGKVDRDRLPAAEVSLAPAWPRPGAERALAALWADLLGVDNLSRHDDFFALGGNSMTAAKLLARITDAFGVELALRAVFDHRSLAELSEEIERRIVADIAAMSTAQIEAELAHHPPGPD